MEYNHGEKDDWVWLLKKGTALDTYIQVRKTQIFNYIATPLYILNQQSGHVLYKDGNEPIDESRYARDGFPELFIRSHDRDSAVRELQRTLNKSLVEKIKSGAAGEVKEILCEIVRETFSERVEKNMEALPETIDVVYDGYAKAAELLKDFSDITYAGYTLVDHSVNVMTLAMFYCLHNGFSEHETKRISLCALLHDVGLTKLPKSIVSYQGRLPDRHYHEYQTHAAIGHDLVKLNENVDSSIAIGILEHHERLDGKGYPRGIANISFEGRLIGLIDSFDSLTSSEKTHRRRKKPFDAMMVIREETQDLGRFDKEIFYKLCMSLGKTDS